MAQLPDQITTPEQLIAALAGGLADEFATWVTSQPGLQARIDEQQCRDLAEAFMAGYKHGQKVMARAGATQRKTCPAGVPFYVNTRFHADGSRCRHRADPP
jgi:hypothetical protein